MSRIYGLHPWDLDSLTDGEVDRYLDDAMKRTTLEAAGGA